MNEGSPLTKNSLIGLALLLSCLYWVQCKTDSKETTQSESQSEVMTDTTFGAIEKSDPGLDALIQPGAKIEVLSEGYEWTEGPVWIPHLKMLLFSDIPRNSIYQWTEENGAQLYLKPAGYTGLIDRQGEPGSNGLLLDAEGDLILCQHGDRRIAKLLSSLEDPGPEFQTMASHYDGKRLNSPNDGTFRSNGDLLFTDPPYGLQGNMKDPAKELDFQGVYLLPQGQDTPLLLTSELSRPNGIALSPDEKKVYIANSDPEKAIWMQYDLDGNTLINGEVFYDATDLVGTEKGLPDGLKVHTSGNIFATGPGGVWIFSKQGKVLGKIKTGQATANCAFDNEEDYLYITADMFLLRVKMKT